MRLGDTAACGTRPLQSGPHTLRTVFSLSGTDIAVITAFHERPLGITCYSLDLASLDPPYVSFSPSTLSTVWPAIRSAARMCVNILAEGQETVCAQFCRGNGDDFGGIHWSEGINGTPQLHGAAATIEADLEYEYGTGEDTVVVAHVTAAYARQSRALHRPHALYNPCSAQAAHLNSAS